MVLGFVRHGLHFFAVGTPQEKDLGRGEEGLEVSCFGGLNLKGKCQHLHIGYCTLEISR
jgi:hypothetical protein